MEKKHVKKFEYEHGIAIVHYDELPSQEDWIKCCSIIMKDVFEKQKNRLGRVDSKKLNNKI